jgi:hypothetical protein
VRGEVYHAAVSRDRSPGFVALFLALLFLPQGVATATQFVKGFRPFTRAPVRVPLSWDMFAVTIARCDVRWTPPLRFEDRDVGALTDMGWIVEFDPTRDHVNDYRWEARRGCRHARAATRAALRCFTDDGLEWDDAFDCP